MITFHHMGYLVSDINKSVKAFKALGYQEMSFCGEFIKDDHIRKSDICFLKNGEIIVELVSPNSDESPVKGLLKKFKNMSYHMCMNSDDIEHDLETLKKSGFVVFQESEYAPAINNRKIIFLINRQIGIIELVYDAN